MFCGILGHAGDFPAGRVLLTAIRALWEGPEGADPVADRRRVEALEHLRRMEASGGGSSDPAPNAVPAFLPIDAWSAVVPSSRGQRRSLFTAILSDRRSALLYYGLAALDPATREFLVSRPDVLKEILERVGVFSTFGRSLVVRDGRIVVPGGSDAIELWEALAGEKTTAPGPFMVRVLAKDGGRLALLYDGVSHLGEGARRFALGLDVQGAMPSERRRAASAQAQRIDRVRALYAASAAALARWEPEKRPFERIPFDVVHLLLSMRIGSDGKVRGPAWRQLWEAVFDGSAVPDGHPIAESVVPAGRRMDAADVAELLAIPDAVARRRRSETWLFAERVFAGAPATSLKDLLLTLRALPRYPSLLLTLERMGIRAPATYATVVRAAGQLPGADRRVWQFQAALAILERARFARTIDVASADALVRSLCALTPRDGGPYLGAVGRWLEHDFLDVAGQPVLPSGWPAADRALETRVLAAMAGSVSSTANAALLDVPPVEWEGLRYRVDPAGAALRRLAGVRAKQGGSSLDGVLACARLAHSLRTLGSASATISVLEQLRDAVAPLAGPRPGAPENGAGRRLTARVAEAIERAKALPPAPDSRMLERLAASLEEALDEPLGQVLGSLAYAPHLGEADGPALLGGDPSTVHEFRLFRPGTELGRRTAWELPIEAHDAAVGWHLSGSLLGLDLALGRLALRRISREVVPEAPRVSDAVRQAFTETAVLMVPFDLTPGAREELLRAVDRGRQRVNALASSSPEIPQVTSEAELDEWRAQVLPWTLEHEPSRRLDLFSLAELARLGGLDSAATRGLDAFGTSGQSLDAGAFSIYPVHLPWSTLAGRRGVRGVGALVIDLTIGLAEASAALRLPAQLTAGLVLVATSDFLDTLRTAHEDDWLTMVAHAKATARARFDDYVAALTIGGPLAPDDRQ